MFKYIAAVVSGIVVSSAILYRRHRPVLKIEYVLFDERAIIPKRATGGSVGYDIFTFREIVIPPRTTVRIQTGFGIKLPPGYFPEIHARSSLSIKNTTIGAGIIDEDYTMEISVIFANLSTTSLKLDAGSAIAQFKIHKVEIIDKYVVVKELKKTTRTGGFGSTNS